MIAPTALCTALDIGLSNASLHYISLSFYTIIKSTVPLWVLIFALIFRLERFNWSMIFIVFIICTGVGLTAAGEVQFSWFGFLLIQLASMASGLRWSLTQMLLPRSSTASHPVATLYQLSPYTFVFFGMGTLAFETGEHNFMNSKFFQDFETALETVSLLVGGGVIALLMTLSQFYFVQKTSVLTFSVAGIFKVVFMIIVSIGIMGDTMTPAGFMGMCVSMAGISLYSAKKLSNNYNRSSKPPYK